VTELANGSPGSSAASAGISHPLLAAAGVGHAFGERDSAEPPRVVRPRQVHGVAVAETRDGEPVPAAADAIVSSDLGFPVGIITADCVPVLASSADGLLVAAIHAGWRGLAAGVVSAGIAALRTRASPGIEVIAVVGPHIGACCYEVDSPVLEPLEERFGQDLASAISPVRGRPGHALLDLGHLVAIDLLREGIRSECLGRIEDACTCCNPRRFHSYRRDGERAGRLLHYVAPRGSHPVSE